MSSPPGVAAPARCVPCLTLFAETLFVDDGTRHGDELQTAMLRLEFDYGGRQIRASAPNLAGRDRDAELQACRVLEGLGAIELAHLDDCAVSPGTGVDYVLAVDGDVHALCAFGAYALPQLRAMGWRIAIDPAYPWQVVPAEAPLYASALPDPERPDWFGLELGVELEGHRIDLLPALLELLDDRGRSDLADPVVAALRRGPRRRAPLAAGAAGAAAPARQGAVRAVPRGRARPRAADPRAAGGRAVLDAPRRRAPAALGRRHEDPRAGLRARARPATHRRGGRARGAVRGAPAVPARRRRVAPAPARARRRRRARRRHGPRQDAADDRARAAREGAGPARSPGDDRHADAPGRQLAARARPVRADACASPSTTAPTATRSCRGSAGYDVVVTTYPMVAARSRRARRAAAPRARARRGAGDQEPRRAGGRGRARARRPPRSACRARRSRTTSASCGRCSTS